MKAKPLGKDCPCCGKCLDIDTPLPGRDMGEAAEPADVKPGDVTFCFQCRTVLVINEGLNIVLPDPFTLMEIVHDPSFQAFVNEIDLARKSKPNMN